MVCRGLMVVIDRADATLRHLARYWETFRQKDDSAVPGHRRP